MRIEIRGEGEDDQRDDRRDDEQPAIPGAFHGKGYVVARRGVYSLDPAEPGAVVIDLRLERRHPLAGLLELLDGALELQLEARDPLLQFHRFRHVDLVGASARGRSAVTTDAVQCRTSVRKLFDSVTSNNGRAGTNC